MQKGKGKNRRMRVIMPPKPKPKPKDKNPKTSKWRVRVTLIVSGIGLVSSVLGFTVLVPKVEVSKRDDAINSRDQISYPLEIKNTGLCAMRDIMVSWKNFEASNSGPEARFSGTSKNIGKEIFIKKLRSDRTATVPPPGWIYEGPTWDRAAFEIHIAFKHLFLFNIKRAFRYEGKKFEGTLRWYKQPALEERD